MKHGGRTYGYKPEPGPKDDRHKPGVAYSCDARNFGAKRLCPLHENAEALAKALKNLMDAEGGEPGDSPEQQEAWAHAEQVLRDAGRARG